MTRSSTARIPLDPPRTLVYRLTEWYSRRRFGTVADPAAAMGHNPRVLVTNARHEMALEKWHALDPTLKDLAQMASAVTIGCSWCVDFGYWVATRKGTDPVKLRDVPRWRDSDVFTDLERRVLAYAEATSLTPPAVTDEMVAGLRRDLDDAALVELTMMVAVENSRSRFNSALGLTSQGFRDRCEVPVPTARTAAAPPS
ncbi:AhpD family alkylhydroperoxidase [Geodermatophilus bullaregiensis]|uniref:carboxymuconolactone decarboxylase family protein n=1 Tax=Geodermatophilus bullaregiensis TaxID=1564160 RepID=UPI00195C25DB|nr:carboxymuconolactone decarboxylase family protein [Geodermatophilus bullaregiensis]MBM7805903.1 AhpD family alkylhydroperoxidase [Geodermatophilus bullaregiensis]